MLNGIILQEGAYIMFTNLDDDATQSKCKADRHGPAATKTCADGGVYYLQLLEQNTFPAYPVVGGEVTGYSSLSNNGIDPQVSLTTHSLEP